MENHFSYPAMLESNDEGGFIVSFRDVPEALTEAPNREEALDLAKDALITAIDFYIEDRRSFPEPSSIKEGEVLIDLPTSVVAKILLLNTMVEQNVRPVDLSRKMGITRQEVTRITDLHHSTKIDTIALALRSLGKRLSLSLS